MKSVFILCVLVAVVASRPDETYDSHFDNFNAAEVVENIRLLKSLCNCFLDKGPCSPEGGSFKKLIPEAVQTNCAKCSPKQKDLIRVVIKAFQAKLPELWAELVNKQDPKGIYAKDFQKFINGSD